MYKIYINEKPLILISELDIKNFEKNEHILLTRYPGKPKFLLNYFDMMEKGMEFDSIVLYDENAKKIFMDLKSVANPIKAAGGIVFNDKGKLLVIFRKGFWDLPKGQIATGETKQAAALREVMEETGLKKIDIGVKAGKTYHIFKNKSRYLKISHWYYMKSTQVRLYPEEKEMIHEAKWIDPCDFFHTHHIYASIEDMLKKLEII
ncbi:MAG: NUDIX hydrolase [Deltaproteobacteria bacterium]